MAPPSQRSNFDSENESGKGKTGLQKAGDSDDDINTLNNLVGLGGKDPYRKANNEGLSYPPIQVDTPNTNASVQRYTREPQPIAANYSVLPIGRMKTVAEDNME